MTGEPSGRPEPAGTGGAAVQAPPRFSIVIPTFERRALVVSSVQALAAQEGEENFEVIVVVDGSTDGSATAVRRLDPGFPLTVIEQPNLGSATARNRGAAAARGEVVLFLDDDMEAHPRLLAEHARSHREGEDAVLGHVPLRPDSPPGFLSREAGRRADARLRSIAERGGRVEPTDFVSSQLSVRRDVFERLTGFETTFPRGERSGAADYDFGRRLGDGGYRVAFNARAVSRHRHAASLRDHLRRSHDDGRASVLLVRRYPDQAARILGERERRHDRYLWRWLRRPLAALALVLLSARPEGVGPIRLFRRAQALERLAGIRAAGGVPAPRRVRVLCYHTVSDLNGAHPLAPYSVPARRFRRQLRLVSRFFRFVDADEFRRYLKGGGVPRRAVLITFDDCYRDLLEAGLPTLREVNAPAVAFAATDFVGRASTWVAGERGELPLLDAAGLRALQRAGVAIGAHTRSHPMLDRLPPGEVAAEIEGSIADVEAFGLPRPSLLAYPYGAHDPQVLRAAAAAGLAGAFTTVPGLVRPGGNPYAIPRIEILREDGSLRFAWKVATGRRGKLQLRRR